MKKGGSNTALGRRSRRASFRRKMAKKLSAFKEKTRCLNLRLFNRIFLILLFILCSIMVVNFVIMERYFKNYVGSSDDYAVASNAAINMQSASDYLTDESRYFVITRDVIHMTNYFDERENTCRREQAVAAIKSVGSMNKAAYYIESAMVESKRLEELEIYAMRLVVDAIHLEETEPELIPQPVRDVVLTEEDAKLNDDYKVSQAWLMLFSQKYITTKNLLTSYKSFALSEIFNCSQSAYNESLGRLHGVYNTMQSFLIAIFITGLIFFIFIITNVIHPLYALIKNIRDGKTLPLTKTEELNILCHTYNEMYMRYTTNEILLKHKAEHDQLTGLINRTAFDEIKKTLENSKDPVALVLIDVDFFKEVNDTYGHVTGDKVLQHVAHSLKASFRTTDYVGRTGGDEFAVIMTGFTGGREVIESLARTKVLVLRDKLKNPPEGIPAPTVSMGIAISENGYSDKLYEDADVALYKVKKAGRDGFEIYS